MAKLLILTFSILFSKSIFAQSGALIFTVICNDGILIVADSRGLIFDSGNLKKPPVAYIDSNLQIFKLSHFGIAIVGSTAFDCQYFDHLINDFNSTFPGNQNVPFTFSEFKKYYYQKFPANRYPTVTKNSFLGGGYFNGVPVIVSFDSKKDTSFAKDGILCNDSKAANFLYRFLKANPQNGEPNCLNISETISLAINEYANQVGRSSGIGGALSVLQITPDNKFHYLQNDFSNRVYLKYGDFIRKVLRKEIKISPLVRDGDIKAINVLKSSPCLF